MPAAEYSQVNDIWMWSKKLLNIRDNHSADPAGQRMNLVKICGEAVPKIFYDSVFYAPSSKVRELISTHTENIEASNAFALNSILKYFYDHLEKITEENVQAILIILIDTALYKAFNIMSQKSHCRFLYQLNMCVILDAMIIKPDINSRHSIDIIPLIEEVSRKAKVHIDTLNSEIVWTLAMLNYKVHQYKYAADFFSRYLTMNNKNDEAQDLRILHTPIYIGYCYEKSKDFSEAIKTFEDTLSDLNRKEHSDEIDKAIRELHHGLGHFYNERAIFTNEDRSVAREDIILARDHMEKALADKLDYYSCFGSLFHEYGDYETALKIFKQAINQEGIKNDAELKSELDFYIAQAQASLARETDKNFEASEANFKKFEEYCESTYNNDGIVHARIFKIRTLLRNEAFAVRTAQNRLDCISKITNWRNELTEYSLSSYASGSIKEEYEKIISILNVFECLYADKDFEWHAEDLSVLLHQFISLMPESALRLDYSPMNDAPEKTNVFQISFDNMYAWCIGRKTLDSEEMGQNARMDDICSNLHIHPVESNGEATRSITDNGKPDLIILLPPHEYDPDFENSLKTVLSDHTERYFIICPNQKANEHVNYTDDWFADSFRGRSDRWIVVQNESEALRYAYCFRAFEVLRKELLKPIPLFSLAPTHFSSSYDFQLGEFVELVDLDDSNNNTHNNTSKKARQALDLIDKKYQKGWIAKILPATDDRSDMAKCLSGYTTVCCPEPTDYSDNFLTFTIYYPDSSNILPFLHSDNIKETYSIKVLPSYYEDYNNLRAALTDNDLDEPCTENCTPSNDELCTIVEKDKLNKTIINYCKKIISVTCKADAEVTIDRCIIKKQKPLDYKNIYIVFKKGELPMPDSHPTVFVTYSWEKGDEKEKYVKEVKEFVDKLRDNGYDAQFDLSMLSHFNNNWTTVMTAGLQMDKVIVLLSEQYKNKANDYEHFTGVRQEYTSLVSRFSEKPNSIILAKLPSQKDIDSHKLLPICFKGTNVIDLAAENDKLNGFNLLFAQLADSDLIGLKPVNKTQNRGEKL